MVLDFPSLFFRLGQAGRRINNILYRISQNEGIKVERGKRGVYGKLCEEGPLACSLAPLSFCVAVMKTRDM